MPRLVSIVRRLALPVATAIATVGVGLLVPPAQAQPVSSESLLLANNQSVTALAQHLRKIGAKMYGAYWCPYCKRQIQLFGPAFQAIDYVECDPRGQKPRPQLCKAANIQGYPTWAIKGKLYPGVQSLEELVEASGYQGPKNF